MTDRLAAACAPRCRSPAAGCGADLSGAPDHRGRSFPGRRPERCGGAHRRRADGQGARPDHGDRECRRRRRHDRLGARRQPPRRTATRCSPAAWARMSRRRCSRRTSNTTRSRDFEPIGFTAHAPAVIVARKDFPAKDLREFVAYLKTERRSREAGAWRHRRLLAHGLPAVHRRRPA